MYSMCESVKQIVEWNFSNLVISIFLNSLHSTEFFIIFPVSFSVANKKSFSEKKHGATRLVFKIDAIYGKKWVKFVAMQQNSATLMYETVQFQA